MGDLVPSLQARVEGAATEAVQTLEPAVQDLDPAVRRSDRSDFQINAAFELAKRVGAGPRSIAEALAQVMRTKDIVANAEASGPGFVNLTVRDDVLWENLRSRLDSSRLGIPKLEAGRRTVIDYSSPNIAKEMHVGHLRTTVLGDCLARVLQFLGAKVIRQNHLGDWGSQFGMLIQYLDENPGRPWRAADLSPADSPISALDDIYQDARAKFDHDAGFALRARSRVVELQRGDPQTLALWREIVDESEKQFRKIYERLDVSLAPEDSFGESQYNSQLGEVVAELSRAGVAEESEGAVVVLSERFTAPDGRPVPLILRKSDGGYGYDATDLAAIRYRTRVLRAQRLIYVTDSRQSTHFQMIFDAARRGRMARRNRFRRARRVWCRSRL